jgi:flagellar protein FlaG
MQINSLNQKADLNSQPNKFAEKSEAPKIKEKEAPVSQGSDQQPVVTNLKETKGVSIEQNTNLNFKRDDKTNQLVVELVDKQTGEVVRQNPSEVSLKLAAIFAQTQGNLLDKQF